MLLALFLELMSTMNIKRSRKNIRNKIHFSYWLAGLIDGDGWLGVSKKGYTCCEITVGIREFSILSRIKEHLGGSISLRKNIAAYRWRLHNRVGMEKLVDHINGKLLLRKRQEQFQNVCNSLGKYTNQGERIRKGVESSNPDPLASSTSKPTELPLPFSFDPPLEKKTNEITDRAVAPSREWNRVGHVSATNEIMGLKPPASLKKDIFLDEMDGANPTKIQMIQKCETTPSVSVHNYWPTGFFEAEGYFHINKKTLQFSITCTQKTPDVLLYLVSCFGGHIYYDRSWKGYLYTASSQQDLKRWFHYFAQFPLQSIKAIDLVRLKRLYLLKQRKDHIDLLRKVQFFKRLKAFHERTSK